MAEPVTLYEGREYDPKRCAAQPKEGEALRPRVGFDEVGEQQGGYPGGDIVTLKCRNCGNQKKAELPQ